jgi:phosphoribosylanthranilate isomerase
MVPEVKVCGITRLEDGQNAISLGASFLGFIFFEGSPRCIDPEKARKIWGGLNPTRTHSVAVDVNPDPSRLSEISRLGFDFFQLHFPSSVDPDRISEWAEIVGPENLWLAPRISPEEDFPVGMLPFADTFLVDAYDKEKFGGTGLSSDWERFSDWKSKYADKRWILAGGIGPENLRDALVRTSPHVVDVNSAVESEPGVKDHEKVKKVFSIAHG